jgi:murein DD-endopeptidase MepM/ murein hydrolase activator NlpD
MSIRDTLGQFRGAFRDELAGVRAGLTDEGAASGLDRLAATQSFERTGAAPGMGDYLGQRLGGFGQASSGLDRLGTAARWSLQERAATDPWAGFERRRQFTQGLAQQEQQAKQAQQVRAQGVTGYQGGDPETDPYRADIDAAAKEFGLDGDTLAAIMAVESHGKADARSPAGATGLMQVMPMHFQAGEDPFDPKTNIRVGARVLAGYVKQYNGDLDTAIRAYHGFGSDAYTNDTQYLGLVKQRRLQIQNARAQAPQASGDGTGPVPSFTGDYQLHWGEDPGATDIMMPEGTPVVSIGAGTVVDSSFNSVGGNSVTVRLDNGLTVYMAHFRDPSPLRAGQRVAPGSFVGYVGQTGNAAGTGTHLHIGIGPTILSGTGPRGGAGAYANGQPFDAVGYLRGLRRGPAAAATPTTRPATTGRPIRY